MIGGAPLTTRSLTPPPSPPWPRLGQRASSSSKKMIHGDDALARWKTCLTDFSDSPTYLSKSSGPGGCLHVYGRLDMSLVVRSGVVQLHDPKRRTTLISWVSRHRRTSTVQKSLALSQFSHCCHQRFSAPLAWTLLHKYSPTLEHSTHDCTSLDAWKTQGWHMRRSRHTEDIRGWHMGRKHTFDGDEVGTALVGNGFG